VWDTCLSLRKNLEIVFNVSVVLVLMAVLHYAAVDRPWVRRVLRSFALISFVSVSINTPKTFETKPYLAYVTFVADLIVTFAFSAEMIAKMHIRGIVRVFVTSYFIQ